MGSVFFHPFLFFLLFLGKVIQTYFLERGASSKTSVPSPLQTPLQTKRKGIPVPTSEEQKDPLTPGSVTGHSHAQGTPIYTQSPPAAGPTYAPSPNYDRSEATTQALNDDEDDDVVRFPLVSGTIQRHNTRTNKNNKIVDKIEYV